jgi:hypothetical protein
MISVIGSARTLCDGVSRREVLRLGGLALVGLALPELLARRALGAPGGRAKSCILFFQEGGMAHQDTWDIKPEAPSEVRGEFGPIRASVPGTILCEHMPELARTAHRYAIIRSVTHDIFDHNPGAYYCLTGRSPRLGSGLIQGDRRDIFPGYGAVVAKLRPGRGQVPDFVHVPALLDNNGDYLPGQKAGFLGGKYDPLVIGDPLQPEFAIPGLTAPGTLSRDRLSRRETLLRRVRSQLDHLNDAPLRDVDAYYERAFRLLTSSATRRACDLEREPVKVRERYGMHHMGQTFLLARRLVEAGVGLVTVSWGPKSGSDSNQCWDTHRRNFHFLKNSLLPPTDRGLAALIEDLRERGLLEETLVVAMGEFGRTPAINKAAGRDHWPGCYSVMMAGGGIRGGAVYGASDRSAAYPAQDPVSPEDIAATIYFALGMDPRAEIVDPLGRPFPIALGQPIRALFG